MAIKKAADLEKRGSDIEAMVPYWEKVEAIVDGYESVKAGGTKYLPKFPNEEDTDYNSRLSLTKFTNVYRDVLEGLASKPFEEEVKLINGDGSVPPKEILDFIEDVDGSGNNITAFAAEVFFNGINAAVDWIFVDYPTVDNELIRSVADVKKAGMKPYWSRIAASNMIEIRSEVIKGGETLVYVRFYEFDPSKPQQIREIERNDAGEIIWTLWEKMPRKEGDVEDFYQAVAQGTISIGVIPMVPFMTGRRSGKSFKFLPPMKGAADLQIELYQEESGLKFIKALGAYPMLAANGMKPDKNPDGSIKRVALGPMRILYGTPDAAGNHGKWEFIQPDANIMDFLQKSIESTIQNLRELGKQPLTALTGQLTVVTTMVAAGKARSAVSAWALFLKNALEEALVLTNMWLSVQNYDPQVNVYSDFDTAFEGNADLEALDKARARGDISQETFWEELQRRKVLAPEFNAVQERGRLLDEIPSGNGVDTNPNVQPGNAVQ